MCRILEILTRVRARPEDFVELEGSYRLAGVSGRQHSLLKAFAFQGKPEPHRETNALGNVMLNKCV